jgi:NADPH:quinone reductase-like Zn-dependent oxidoreductase
MKAEGWFLYPGDGSRDPRPGTLTRETFELRAPRSTEVLIQPLFGSWEGNMGHALQRRPIDVCLARNEPRVILGNSGVARVIQVGKDVTTVAPGQHALIFGVGELDRYGYMIKAHAYDAPGTIGTLATHTVLDQRSLIPLPARSRHSLMQWAAFSLRYPTAWANWELAYGAFRLQLGEDELPTLHVWGWGGGSTLGELDLAARLGHRAVMLSGHSARLATIARSQVIGVDRRQFGELSYDPDKLRSDRTARDAYHAAEAAFLAEVERRTGGDKVHIFVDYIGQPVFRATLKALARQGVITTAGWKHGMDLSVVRAIECIERHQHIHTHFARYAQGVAAVAFAERTGWLPPLDGPLFSFDEIPALAEQYSRNSLGMFPVFAIA